jgi:hypothetical protein
MFVLFWLLAVLCGLGSTVCFVVVVIKMFQKDQSTLGIVCIVLYFCANIGNLIAFVYGWMNATAWDIKNVMLAWTGCIVGAILFVILAMASAAVAVQTMPGLPR